MGTSRYPQGRETHRGVCWGHPPDTWHPSWDGGDTPPRGCPSTHREEKAVKGLVGDTGTHPKGPWGQSEDPLDSQETPPKNHFR